MKRTLLAFGALMLGGGMLMAQTATTKTIRGVVVDPNGNPVPGALIQATGGAETEVADADGSYEMEVPVYLKSISVSYPGFRSQKTKLNTAPFYVTELKEPRGRVGLSWFVDAVGSVVLPIDAYDEDHPQGQIGLMGGVTYNGYGGYAKIQIRCGGKHYSYGSPYYDSYVSDGITYTHSTTVEQNGSYGALPTITIGYIRQFSKTFGWFFGGGLGWNIDNSHERFSSNTSTADTMTWSDVYTNNYGTVLCGALETGFMFNVSKHVNLMFGFAYTTPNHKYDYDDTSYSIGYSFSGDYNEGLFSGFIGLGYTY